MARFSHLFGLLCVNIIWIRPVLVRNDTVSGCAGDHGRGLFDEILGERLVVEENPVVLVVSVEPAFELLDRLQHIKQFLVPHQCKHRGVLLGRVAVLVLDDPDLLVRFVLVGHGSMVSGRQRGLVWVALVCVVQRGTHQRVLWDLLDRLARWSFDLLGHLVGVLLLGLNSSVANELVAVVVVVVRLGRAVGLGRLIMLLCRWIPALLVASRLLDHLLPSKRRNKTAVVRRHVFLDVHQGTLEPLCLIDRSEDHTKHNKNQRQG
ncbi:hypothetical protein OGAPHI_000783 [Ogataea philodendri]|uniref:Secreted protein n=1 Tax=Ogataea philodendri TaxID=1378263 RepID=A0A9P8PFG7_9ASCO|nr:uncharacterized protein OGAPHI_000783 [Ogataea philodendri]KAH3671072.1 hypothetical protein OGAPHI_000783 [Ogataea philodendri]